MASRTRETVARAKLRKRTRASGGRLSRASFAAFRMETVVFPEPGPPVTSRCPLAFMISFCPVVRSTTCGRFRGRHFVSASCTSFRNRRRIAELLQRGAGVANPLWNLRFAALGQEVCDTPVAFGPTKIHPKGCDNIRLGSRILCKDMRRPFKNVGKAFHGGLCGTLQDEVLKAFLVMHEQLVHLCFDRSLALVGLLVAKPKSFLSKTPIQSREISNLRFAARVNRANA